MKSILEHKTKQMLFMKSTFKLKTDFIGAMVYRNVDFFLELQKRSITFYRNELQARECHILRLVFFDLGDGLRSFFRPKKFSLRILVREIFTISMDPYLKEYPFLDALICRILFVSSN